MRLSWNSIFTFFLFYVPLKMSSRTPGGTRTPGWIPLPMNRKYWLSGAHWEPVATERSLVFVIGL
jgi:hypothetical protein